MNGARDIMARPVMAVEVPVKDRVHFGPDHRVTHGLIVMAGPDHLQSLVLGRTLMGVNDTQF
jgi:hypothetical protein